MNLKAVTFYKDLQTLLLTIDLMKPRLSNYLLILFFNDNTLTERKLLVYKILESIEKTLLLHDKLQLIVDGLVKFFDAKFARIWLLDKNEQYLILKFSAGKYKNNSGEFSKISINSLKIGYIAKSSKPIITNDVANDPRIKYPEWAKKEKLVSFAGYPLKHKGK